MALQGLQTQRAGLASRIGKWQPLFDRLYSVDLHTVPIGAAGAIPVVPGIEDYVVIFNGVTLQPLADPTTLIQTEFPQVVGTVYDQNGQLIALPLPHAAMGPGLRTIAALQTFTDGVPFLEGPVVLAPGFGLSVYGVGVLQAATNYRLLVSFTLQQLTPTPCKNATS